MPILEHVAIEKGLDHTPALLQEGYLFIGNRAKKFDTNLFETHVMGEKVICMTGEEASKVFYDGERFQRNGAAPMRIQKTLFGVNAIQSMDGEAHLHRKQLFMSLMTSENYKKLTELVNQQLEIHLDKWTSMDQVILFDEVNEILCKTACSWAGVPIEESEVKERAEDFSSMVDAFGKIGPSHQKGKKSRTKTEAWLQEIIEEVRLGKRIAYDGSPLQAMANHMTLVGCQMHPQMAAIELINIIRPIVAISTYITFAALALHDYPQCKDKLISRDPNYLEWFVQEVRRFYPFGPFVGARVKKDFTWEGCDFKVGTLVLLDMYGTNHDPRLWSNPDSFEPLRFQNRQSSQFDLIPQGGGDPNVTHRCPGEGVVTEIMKTSVDFLVNKMEYKLPDQDFGFPLNKIPTLPESRFVLTNVKRKIN